MLYAERILIAAGGERKARKRRSPGGKEQGSRRQEDRLATMPPVAEPRGLVVKRR